MFLRLSYFVREIITNRRNFRKRILLIFILIVYLPVALNLYTVYDKAVEVIKREKTIDMNNILEKTQMTVEIAYERIIEKIENTSQSTALRKVMMERKNFPKIYKEKTNDFFLEQFKTTNEKNIRSIFCIANDGEVLFTTGDNIRVGEYIKNSKWYQEFMASNNDTIWNVADFECKENEKNCIIITKKIMGIKNEFTAKDTEEVLGSIVFFINSNFWDSLNIENHDDYGISIYYNNKILLGEDFLKTKFEVSNTTIQNSLNKNVYISTIDKKQAVLSSRRVSDENLTMTCYSTIDNYVSPIKNAFKNSIYMILIVGLLAILWIIIEVLIITKLVTEKQMSQFRLMASEEANQRFRIFKHDLMNHLQIIQGLLQMKQYDKAFDYSLSLTNEGKLLVNRCSIGIPELESAIFQSLSNIEDKNIEVRFDFCSLPQDLPVKTYDLVRIMINLIKNAIYALESTEAKEKILEINISEGLGEYIFEVCNNVPIIPSDITKQIFEKGFTTKGSKGNGLGLHIVKTLTERNMGVVELKIDEKGNHFIVRLPN